MKQTHPPPPSFPSLSSPTCLRSRPLTSSQGSEERCKLPHPKSNLVHFSFKMTFGGSNFNVFLRINLSKMPILVHFEDEETAGTLLVAFTCLLSGSNFHLQVVESSKLCVTGWLHFSMLDCGPVICSGSLAAKPAGWLQISIYPSMNMAITAL